MLKILTAAQQRHVPNKWLLNIFKLLSGGSFTCPDCPSSWVRVWWRPCCASSSHDQPVQYIPQNNKMCINDCGSPVLPATVSHIRISNIFVPGSGNRDPGLPNAEPNPVINKSIPKAEIYFDRRSFQRKRSNFSYIFLVSSKYPQYHTIGQLKISFYQRVSLQFKNKYPRDLF